MELPGKEGKGGRMELPEVDGTEEGMWSSQVSTLEECVDLSSALRGKHMHGMAQPVCVT